MKSLCLYYIVTGRKMFCFYYTSTNSTEFLSSVCLSVCHTSHVVYAMMTDSCRRPIAHPSVNYFAGGYAADVDGVNFTAVCERRGGICTMAADCATNSAVDLTGTGSRYAPYLNHIDDDRDNDQIRSFMCNLTAICCLPRPTYTGSPCTAIRNTQYTVIMINSLLNFTLIGATCHSCEAKNRKIGPWVKTLRAVLPVIKIVRKNVEVVCWNVRSIAVLATTLQYCSM